MTESPADPDSRPIAEVVKAIAYSEEAPGDVEPMTFTETSDTPVVAPADTAGRAAVAITPHADRIAVVIPPSFAFFQRRQWVSLKKLRL